MGWVWIYDLNKERFWVTKMGKTLSDFWDFFGILKLEKKILSDLTSTKTTLSSQTWYYRQTSDIIVRDNNTLQTFVTPPHVYVKFRVQPSIDVIQAP